MMNKWFFGGVGRAVVTSDFRVGGEFRNDMRMKPTAGTGGCSDGTKMEEEISRVHTGEFLEIVPPEKLVFTWNSSIVTNSRVTVELKDLGESTEIWITHDQLETEDLRSKHNGGWTACLENLGMFLENTGVSL